jgi:hypothetical protein
MTDQSSQPSEDFGKVPNPSETFGTLPNPAEPFRTVRKHAERTENHTLTVREVARKFEEAGVPRTERSIINWCQLNRQGVARLDAFFDENEGRYYITPQSVSRAIKEEQAKQAATGNASQEEIIPHRSETAQPRPEDSGTSKEWELKLRDLEITNRAKDMHIERLETDRTKAVEQLVGMSRYVGELETKLLQLGGAPNGDSNLLRASEPF